MTTNVNGTARNSNNTRIDGAANVFTWLPHHAFYVPPMESIETVNIATNNFDAEQGMAGGAAVSVITKSGTNSFHGVAFEYTPTTSGARRTCSSIPTRRPGRAYRSASTTSSAARSAGRIMKDKLFFFISWEGTTTAERGNGLLSVPTAQVRTGNFAGLATIYDPATGNPVGQQAEFGVDHVVAELPPVQEPGDIADLEGQHVGEQGFAIALTWAGV